MRKFCFGFILLALAGAPARGQFVFSTANNNNNSGVTATLNGVAYDGAGVFVAVSADGHSIRSALANSGWTANSVVSPKPLYCITYSSGLFVAGTTNAVYSSSNGGGGWSSNSTPFHDNVVGLALNNGRFVAVAGLSYNIAYSTGLPTWHPANDHGTIFDQYTAVTPFGATEFAACGLSGLINISTNSSGVNWHPTNYTTANLRGIATSGSTIVAVGDAGAIVVSLDSGKTWNKHNYNSTSLSGVCYAGTQFIAVGSSGLVLTSPDGVTWAQQGSQTTDSLYGAAFANSGTLSKIAVLVGASGKVVIGGFLPTVTSGVSLSQGEPVLCNGSSAPTLSASFGGSPGPWNVTWASNGVPIASHSNVTSSDTETASSSNGSTVAINTPYTIASLIDNYTLFSGTSLGSSAQITINPTPTVSQPADQADCNGVMTDFTVFGTYTYVTWSNDNPGIGLAAIGSTNGTDIPLVVPFVASNSGTNPITAHITLTPVYANGGISCTGSPESFAIIVNPTPTINLVPANQTDCNGATTNFTFFGTYTNVTWLNDNPAIGLAANGSLYGTNIPLTVPFTASNAGATSLIAHITLTAYYGDCVGSPQTFTVIVNPTPTISLVPTNQADCNGALTNFTFFGTYTNVTWLNDNPAIGLAANGSTNGTDIPLTVPFTALNTGTNPLTAHVTLTPSYGECVGSPQNFTIVVNPTPTVSQPSSSTNCNFSIVTFSWSGTYTNVIWNNDTPSIGLTASGSTNGNVISFTATNVGTAPTNANVTLTPYYGDCIGSPQTFTITVNPTPVVTQPASTTNCNLSSVTVNWSGTYTEVIWSNSTPSIGLPALGTNTGTNLSFTVTNIGTAPTNATITLTPYYGACSGSNQTFDITVNPTPSVSQPASTTNCNLSAVTVNWSGTFTEVTWSNDSPGIGLPALGTNAGNSLSFTATNNGSVPINATITLTPYYGTCSGPASAFTITVVPLPSENSLNYITGPDITNRNCLANPTFSVTFSNSDTANWYYNGSFLTNTLTFTPTNTTAPPGPWQINPLVFDLKEVNANGCESTNVIGHVNLYLAPCTNALSIAYQSSNRPPDVVLQWYGNLPLFSTTNLNPISWTRITNPTTIGANWFTNVIHAPTNEYFLLERPGN